MCCFDIHNFIAIGEVISILEIIFSFSLISNFAPVEKFEHPFGLY